MEKTFDHLLGLSARSALAILAGYGITGVRVSLTGAPPRTPGKALPETQPPPARLTALEALGRQFSVGDDEDEDASPSAAPDPLYPDLDPILDGDVLTEARVVAVREDGRRLILARFRVGDPKPAR